MEWLSQNWVWLAFAAGMLLMMRRGGAGGCCGGQGQGDGGTQGGPGRERQPAAAADQRHEPALRP